MTTFAPYTPPMAVLLIATPEPNQTLQPAMLHWLDATVRHHGGTIFLQHADRIGSVFTCSDDALTTALAVLHEQLSHIIESRLRLALHCGLLDIRAIPPGPALPAAVRLLNVAHPGQLLLSATFHAQLATTLPAYICLHLLGSLPLIHRLRYEPIYQLCAPHAHADFPSLPTLEPASPPSPMTPLVGREAACAEIARLLRSPHVQLITLTGPGGVGKTRLALAVADELEVYFLDGIVVVPFAAVRSPDLILPTIAHALTAIGITAPPTIDGLRQALAHKKLLLILDNLEHLSAGSVQLVALAKALPNLRMLLTSRVSLQLSCEQEYIVPPLTLPDDQSRAHTTIADTPAVQLFIQVACRVHPNFALTPQNAAAIGAICTRLDGLPLAIELVALHSDRYAPLALLGNLEAYLTAPATSELPDRQRSLQATLDWSYALLDAPAQVLFRRMGVFVGGGSLEAVETVCGDVGLPQEQGGGILALDVFDTLITLIDASMLQQVPDARGQARITMLEPIREYAQEQLVAAGEHAMVHTRHAAYYAAQLGTLNTTRDHPTDWVTQVAVEHPNLVAALEWAIHTSDGQTALHLCAGTRIFWQLRGMHREGLRWCEAALAIGEKASPHLVLEVWQGAGAFASLIQEYTTAEAYTQRALMLARQQGNPTAIAWLLHNLGVIAAFRQQFPQARAYFTESLVVQRQLQRPFAITLYNLAEIAMEEHEDAEAEKLLHQALALTQITGDQGVRVWVLSSAACLRLFTDQAAAAISLLIEAIGICQALDGHDAALYLLWNAVACLEIHGDALHAARLLSAVEILDPQWLQQYGSPRQVAYFTIIRACVCAKLGPSTLATARVESNTLSRMAAIGEAKVALEQIAVQDGITFPM